MRAAVLILLFVLLPACGTEPAGGVPLRPVAWEGDESWRVDRTQLPVVPPGFDIPTHLRVHPRDEYSTDEQGNRIRARYGGFDIDEAVASIGMLPASKQPARPWTVERLLAWYEGPSKDLLPSERDRPDSPRAAAITLLLASRDVRGLRAAGAALDAGDQDVSIAACMGIETYWSNDMGNMNLEMIMTSAMDWWAANKRRYAPR